MNRNYGYLDDNNRIHYAKDYAEVDGVVYTSPKAFHYALENPPKMPIVSRPPTKAGVEFVPTEFGVETLGVIHRRYDERPIVPPAPPVTRYSKLKLIVSAKAAGKWDAFKAFIASAGYEDEWAACQFLSSDYAQFNAAKEAIVAAGIATAEDVEAILAASVDEEVR